MINYSNVGGFHTNGMQQNSLQISLEFHPNVTLMAEMEGLRRKCATLRSYIKVEVKEMMADRGFGGL